MTDFKDGCDGHNKYDACGGLVSRVCKYFNKTKLATRTDRQWK